jgi:deoxyribose-phosphate aldolase
MSNEYLGLSKMIDHALLSPTLTTDDLESGCRMAAAYDVASVCIMPYFVRRCVELLDDSTVLPSTVIGFPHGGQTSSTKLWESKQAIDDGAVELDMVVNISAVLSGRWSYVQDEIKAIVDTAHAASRKVKVIFENCYLQDDHKKKLCEICCDAGADWVKTSTGFGPSGATIEDLKLMIEHTRAPVQVKAAGGIRNLEKLIEVKSLGVTRAGASATTAILDPAREKFGLPPAQWDSVGTGSAENVGY